MPQIPPEVLKATFYLYASAEDAKKGRKFGGTGFFIAVPSAIEGRSYGYAVSNWHVAVRDGFSVIRINKIGGGVDIFELDPADWRFIPNGPDVAVTPIGINRAIHDAEAIASTLLMTREQGAARQIGAGEDVFMVGRFVDHDGGESNMPAVRFGNISVMPGTKIKQPTGAMAESYILDVHSRTGYSGSPVYVYRTPGQDLSKLGSMVIGGGNQFISVLGIHWGQFPERWEIKEQATKPRSANTADMETHLSGSDRYIEGLSGMTLAVPSWDVLDLLEIPELKKRREADNQWLIDKQQQSAPKAESVVASVDNANPAHREDFNSLVNAAARKREPKD